MIKRIDKNNLNDIKLFLNDIDDNFSDNKSINSAPWKNIDENHFRFFGNYFRGNINGAMVSIIFDYNIHLSFLYTLRDKRSSGIGSKFIKYLIENRLERRLITIHVRKELKRTIKFYNKFGFKQYDFQNKKNIELESWIDKCKKYDLHTYENNVLMYKMFK